MDFDPNTASPLDDGDFDPNTAAPVDAAIPERGATRARNPRTATAFPAGMLEPGTQNPLDHTKYPTVKNPNGSVSNVVTASFNIDGKEVLLPTMIGGKRITAQKAIENYKATGDHFGIFDSPASAQAFASALETDMQKAPEEPRKPNSALKAFASAAADSALFGTGDRFVAPAVRYAAHGGSKPFAEEQADVAAERAQDREDAPVASIAGDITGGIASGKAVYNTLRSIPRIGAAIIPRAGQIGRNLLRLETVGGVTGAANAAGSGEDIATGAEVGVAAAPVGAAAGKAVATVARRAADALPAAVRAQLNAVPAAVRTLATRLQTDPVRLAASMQEFRAATGRAPSLVEIMDAGSAEELATIAASRGAAARQFQAAEQSIAEARPATMRARVRQLGPTGTLSEIDATQRDAFNAAIDPIATSTITLPPNTPVALRQAIARDVRANADPAHAQMLENNQITLRTLDNVRQSLNARHLREPGLNFNTIAQRLVALAPQRYRDALTEFGAFERRKLGFRLGDKGQDPGSLEGADARDALTPDSGAGRAIGTVSRLAREAGESPSKAVQTARAIGSRSGVGTEAAGTGMNTQGGLHNLGRAETEGASRLRQVAGTGAPRTARDELAETLRNGVERVVAIGGNALTGYKAHVATRLLTAARVSAKTARQIAEMASDPARTAQTIAALRRARLNDQQIREILLPVGGGAAAAVEQQQ